MFFRSNQFPERIKAILALSRKKKTSIVILSDYIFLVFSFWASLSIRSNALHYPTLEDSILILIGPFIAIPILYAFGLYKSLIRYSNYQSMLTIFISSFIYNFLWLALIFISGAIEKPYDFFLINWLVTTFFVAGSRYFARYFLIQGAKKKVYSLIYGAGSAGRQIYSALNYDSEIRVVGFVDDSEELQGKYIEGLKIYKPESLESIISKKGVTEILITIPSASKAEIARIVGLLKPYEINIRKLPAIGDLASGRIDLSDLKKINIQDLLRRDERSPVKELLERDITEKNVLVTGAGGSIGSELSKQILKLKPKKLVLVDFSEFSLYKVEQLLSTFEDFSRVTPIIADVINQNHLEMIMSENQIQTVYHAAAYKHVPLVERNPFAGVRCNIFGTLSSIQASINQNIESFVFISTDKAVRPTNIMGATKRFAEQILQSIQQHLDPDDKQKIRISIVRFGNVLGSSGSVVPLFRKQLESGGPLTVTDPNIIRYFMTIQEASQLVIQAGSLGTNGEIFLLDMGKPIKILDLARDIIQLSGRSLKSQDNPNGDIEIEFTGLRPGEKLYEELLIDNASEATEHEKIFRAKDKSLDWDTLVPFVDLLDQACKQGDLISIRKIFLEVVDGYTPKSIN